MRKFLSYKGRSIWKGFYSTFKRNVINYDFFERNIVISKYFVGKDLYVGNGKNYKNLRIYNRMIGSKLGQFFLTKKGGRIIHYKGKNLKNQKGLNKKLERIKKK